MLSRAGQRTGRMGRAYSMPSRCAMLLRDVRYWAMACAVLRYCMVLCGLLYWAIVCCYALCGTEPAYAAM
eukprot:1473337-Rhodomonas_salina.1